jgi:glycosyltransferase involved in cell wall biosynthesis
LNILHICAHLGDGAGKAITGLSVSDKSNSYSCYLLDPPQKMKWVDFAVSHKLSVIWNDKSKLDELINSADAVVFNWWECRATLDFLSDWKSLKSSRKLIWAHQNGMFPPFPDGLIKSADKFLVTTPLTLERYPQIGNISDNLVYGFGDFSVDKFTPKADYKVSNNLSLLYVGLCSYKRFPVNVLDYFKAIIKKIPGAKITLFGEVSDDFRQDCEMSEITESLILKGWTSDVVSQIINFDIGIFITKNDIYTTTENSIVESMASGLPVIISHNEPYKYLLENGVSGLFAGSPDEFADSVSALSDDELSRIYIGKNAREYCSQKYSSDNNLKVFLRALEEK